MATTDTDPHGPLIGAGSRVFGAIAAAALLFGGIAGAARDTGGTSGTDLTAARPSGHAASTDTGGHDHDTTGTGDSGHDDDSTGADHGGSHDDAAGADHRDHALGADPGDDAAGARHSGHGESGDHAGGTGHGESGDHAAGAGGESGDHAAGAGHGESGDHAAGAGHGESGDHAGGTGHGESGDHAGTDEDHGYHGAGCADDHPASVSLVAEVRESLDVTYKDVAALVALGYHPYFDSLVPGGYPPGGEGISHWINPNYIDNGVVRDPMRPEAVLLDEWNRPIGMMFINDAGVPPVPIYVNEDGTECSPWHPHTDMPARFGWYYYRAMYDGEMEGGVPEQTPEMMHVWAIPNPAGVYAAHDYPPSEERAGPPGPMPSYFSEGSVVELLRGIFARSSS